MSKIAWVVFVLVLMFGAAGLAEDETTCLDFFTCLDLKACEYEQHFMDGFTLAFSLRGLFLDTDFWNALIPEDSGLPELDGIVRLHGATVAVPTSNGLHFGMSGYGAALNELNELGYTTWKGAMAGLSLESIGAGSVEDVYTHIRLALFCGTFTFSSTGVDGTGVAGYGGAFYFEPSVGLSVQISDNLFAQVTIAKICSLLPGNAWPGGRDTGPDVTPSGPMISLAIGWRGLDW
ncbi:hypothetical protein KJ567_05415 [Candidatus Bipolaricaulota bacterium]|nr:hypothetical protein [Candidatus Bipolaricaulota bacterium]